MEIEPAWQYVELVEYDAHDNGEQTRGTESGGERREPRRTSRGRRKTSPMHAAVTGSRSGLIAIAPTISVGLSLRTASAAMTPAAPIRTK